MEKVKQIERKWDLERLFRDMAFNVMFQRKQREFMTERRIGANGQVFIKRGKNGGMRYA